jgi:SAM-dependent methyltransferase
MIIVYGTFMVKKRKGLELKGEWTLVYYISMNYILLIAMAINLILCLVVVFLLAHLFVRTIVGKALKRYAPFVPIPDQALLLLEDEDIAIEGDTVYDLGCGDGKVLVCMANKFPKAVYIGIEYNIIPYLFAKIKTRKYKNITIKYGDFFKENLSAANSIVVYLFPELMDALLPKFEKELKSGTSVFSLDYAFSKKEQSLIKYNNNKTVSRGKRMLIYQF